MSLIKPCALPKYPSIFDLSSYGINVVLTDQTESIERFLTAKYVATGSFSVRHRYFKFPSGTYTIGDLLGGGGYGQTFDAIHEITGMTYAVKVIKLESHEHFMMSVNEVIINILLFDMTKNVKFGPLVPEFYEIAYDADTDVILCRMERMHGEVKALIQSGTPSTNDVVIPAIMIYLICILNCLSEVQFNHRDCKYDNVMYKRDASGNITLRLIDLGYSCMTWNKLKLGMQHPEFRGSECINETRDLTHFLFTILINYESMSNRMRRVFHKLLKFEINGRPYLELIERPVDEVDRLRKWNNLYYMMANNGVRNPNGLPANVLKEMSKFLPIRLKRTPDAIVRDLQPWLVNIYTCLPEEVYSRRYGRCIPRRRVIPSVLVEEMRNGVPSPLLQVRNIPSRRRDTRKVRRNRARPMEAPVRPMVPLRPMEAPVRPMVPLRPMEAPAQTRKFRPCRNYMVRNPLTNRCVRSATRRKSKPRM
jgi:serine/threonine protein kinase